AGVSWSQVATGEFYDVEAQPGASSNTFYAAKSNTIQRSTDNGATWTQVQSVSGCNRIALAVSAADANTVVALCSSSSNNGFLGFYGSTNAGTSWTLRSSSPNLLGWSSTGNDTGGQGWYDLIVTLDPTNANIVYVGGVNTWKSTNGGTSWSLNTHWFTISGVPAVHADKHAFEWQNNTTLFQGNDGGVYKTTNGGTSWTDLSNGLVISQMYKLGVSQQNNAVIAGLQDNGTKLRNSSGTWSDEIGGDGMECAIDYSNANYMYGELYYGDIQRSSNAGNSWTNISDNIPGGTPSGGAWVTPFIISPVSPTTIYAGYTDVWKTTDRGNTWTQKSSNLTGGSSIRILAAAPSDANVLYAATTGTIYRTTNDGATWTTMTNPSGGGNNISYIIVHPTDPNTIYLTKSGYSAGNKVFKSTNGGSTWTNISGNLPNLPANCITYQTGAANDPIYVGMDIGVYYRNNNSSNWTAFSTGLPNVVVTELEIRNSTGKIRAATYGRGIWESDVEPENSENLTVTPANRNVGQAAGSTTFDVTSNLSWTTTALDNWLSVTPGSGSNNGTLTVNFTANTGSGPRVGTIRVTGGNLVRDVTVTQDGIQTCTTYTSIDVPKLISATGAPTIFSLMNIPNGQVISDINVVGLNITHTWIDDLVIKLKSPANTERTILNRPCNGEDNILINFDDEATNAYDSWPCPPTNNLFYKPFETLSVFDGQNSGGWWTLTVSDLFNGDGGSLEGWGLNVCTVPASITVTASGTNVSCNGGNNGSATATATGGSGSYTYAWSNGGNTQTINNLTAGTYTVTVSDGAISGTASVTITQPAAPLAVVVSGVNATSGNDGSATATPSGGTPAYTYFWSNGGTTQTINNLAPGAYTVTVSDANGCTTTGSVTIAPPPLTASASGTNVSCNGGNNGSATATATGGIGGYTYLWSNGGTTATISNLTAGTYTVTVTSGAQTATASVTITQPAAPLTVAVSGVNATSGNDGSATATPSGGTPAYTYFWSNGGTTQTINNLAPGAYTVTVSDANGCTTTGSVTISGGSPLAVIVNSTNVTCNGAADGTAGATASGGTGSYSFAWSNGATTAAITNLAPGTFTVTVTSGAQTATASVNISEPTALNLAVSKTNPTCNGGSDGTATANASGGTPPYNYLWSNGATTASITGLPVGTYTVTASDANGCTATGSVVLVPPSGMTVTFTIVKPTCFGGSNGSAKAKVTGGTGTKTYLWSTGATTIQISNLVAGTYTVTVTDAIGCTKVANAIITEPTQVSIAFTSTMPSCFGGNNGSLKATASGGTGTKTYLWNTGSTAQTITGLVAGTYTVTATDSKGCSSSSTVGLTEPAELLITGLNVVPSGSTYKVTVTAVGGTGTKKYRRSTGPGTFTAWQTNKVFSNVAAGNYTFQVQDTKLCTDEFVSNIPVTLLAPGNTGARPADAAENQSVATVFQLMPNPAQHFVQIVFEEKTPAEGTLEIADASGKILHRSTIGALLEANGRISLENVPTGVAFVTLRETGRSPLTQILIVQKF
ncbi:MAG: beta strand repeat-containing protein, partial [Saprospiraceae bacterium]